MSDYSDIGLSANLQSLTGPVSQINPTGDQLKEYIDNSINEILRPGGINYTNIVSSGRTYTAIVDTSNVGGAFTDIQDAINYVNTLGGGQILIRNGTYLLAGTILLYDNISLIGEDRTNTILDFDFSGTSQLKNSGVGVGDNCTISNLTIKDANHSATNFSIDFTSVNNITIKGIDFSNVGTGTSKASLYFASCQNIVVEGNNFSNSGEIAFNNITYGKIADNVIGTTSAGAPSILLYGASGNSFINITGNHIDSAQSFGINSAGVLNNVRIVNNSIVNVGPSNGAAMSIATGTECLIANNRCQGTVENGILMTSSNNGCIVSSNISDGFTYGIQVAGTRCVITGNFCQNNGTSILLATVNSERCVVVGNIAVNGIVDNGTVNTVANNVTS